MKNTMLSTAFALAITASIFGCKKGDDKPTTTIPTETEFRRLMDDGYKSLLQTATFDAAQSNYAFTSPKGTKVEIDGTCLRKNGAPVSGQVKLEFYEAFDRKDMLVANKPTMGINSSGDLQLLESGGQFYVSVTQNGVPLTTNCGVNITTPVANSGGYKSGMTGWEGSTASGSLIWAPATNWTVFLDSVQKARYDFRPPGFGWFNCDRFYNDPRPKTAITVKLQEGYSTNSRVFLMPKFLPNALGSATGLFPIGLECYLLFVTGKDDQYQWIIKETTLAANHTEAFNIAEAQTGSRSDWIGHVTLLK